MSNPLTLKFRSQRLFSSNFLGSLLITLLLFIGAGVSHSAEWGWKGMNLGGVGTPGTVSWKDGVLEISGSGAGETQQKDQLYFVSVTHPGGDLEMIARLASFEGEPKAVTGLMVRTAAKLKSPMMSVAFCFKDAKDGSNIFRWNTNIPSEKIVEQGGIGTHQEAPLWLRMVRIGKDFAVYKSPDGKIWSPMGNTSGGHFPEQGPLEVGFFVAGGSRKASATARFDNIQIREPRLAHRTSWVGSTFGGDRINQHVSNGISALWTAPDGTCFTNSPWDEGAEPSKIYRDGKVIKSFRSESEFFGNAGSGLGTITGNGSHVFLAAGNSVYLSDLNGTGSSAKPLHLSVAMRDATKNFNSNVSGLGISGSELFVADARDNCVRVLSLQKPAYYLAGNTRVAYTESPIETSGVPNAAPSSLYQSQRQVDSTGYKIPGLSPETAYTVRCHFADFTEENHGKSLITIHANGSPKVQGFDVVKAAGGKLRAAVLDLPDIQTDAEGNMNLTFERGAGGNGRMILNGLEILTADGSKVFGLNCGGEDMEGFEGEAHEIVSRKFNFERPGAMTTDDRGNLWIIQRGNDHMAGASMVTTKYPAAVKCYRPDGTFTGREITDVVNPTALAFDAQTKELLIAENGPDQNIRIYGEVDNKPKFLRSFGIQGGIYAGDHPGQISDPAAGGMARFYGLTGVGVDAESNLYVACGAQGTDLRKFKKDGTLVWMLNGLFFCNTPDVDPDSDGNDIYGPYVHLGMDYTSEKPGGEWSYQGYNWDLTRFGPPVRVGGSQAMVRRIGPDRKLMLYTSGQGVVESVKIFRYDGELAIPAGEIRNKGTEIWIDANGDGKESSEELLAVPASRSLSSFTVDQKGDIWLALLDGNPNPPVLRHFRFLGLNEHGVPRYGNAPGEYEDTPFPGTGEVVSGWGNVAKVDYDAETDVMILIGPAVSRKGDKEDPIQYMARYDQWSTGNREARWMITLPNPSTDPNFSYEQERPWGVAFGYSAMDAAGDKIFLSALWGEIHVYDALTGERVTVLSAGPEVAGRFAWQDANLGLRAFQRKNGEYLIFTENSGYHAKCHLYRWNPDTDQKTR